jgi:methylenetetrahydrofolate dehydrogenase (NADP+)/methenyltetrahydrofolate cyclohydrolase
MAIIQGKLLAKKLREQIKSEVSGLEVQGIIPGLAVVLVGEDPASRSYVSAKEKACETAGIYSRDIRLPSETTQEELLKLIDQLNEDDQIHGILVQLPLPKQIDEQAVIEAINPKKDVDGFHPVSIGKMMLGEETFLPCTPHGIIKMLEEANIKTSGKEVVIIGRSNIVGKPIANMLLQKGPMANAPVTLCHTGYYYCRGGQSKHSYR